MKTGSSFRKGDQRKETITYMTAVRTDSDSRAFLRHRDGGATGCWWRVVLLIVQVWSQK